MKGGMEIFGGNVEKCRLVALKSQFSGRFALGYCVVS
jgi:hypothetical protein